MNAIWVSCRTRSVTGWRVAVGWPDSSAVGGRGRRGQRGRDGHHALTRRVVAVPACVERGERAAQHDDDEHDPEHQGRRLTRQRTRNVPGHDASLPFACGEQNALR